MAKSWTLKSLIDARMAVQAYCHDPKCHHNQKLNLELLMDHFGPDFPAMAADLEPKLRCSKCGGKKVGLIYAPASNDKLQPGGGHANKYAKETRG